MTLDTVYGHPVCIEALYSYLSVLINRIFKILPIREQEEESLQVYTRSLVAEVLGCQSLICVLSEDPDYLTLASILQYLADHSDIAVRDIRREVFKAISICNKLKAKYGTGGDVS